LVVGLEQVLNLRNEGYVGDGFEGGEVDDVIGLEYVFADGLVDDWGWLDINVIVVVDVDWELAILDVKDEVHMLNGIDEAVEFKLKLVSDFR